MSVYLNERERGSDELEFRHGELSLSVRLSDHYVEELERVLGDYDGTDLSIDGGE